jgi:hypothetical protein
VSSHGEDVRFCSIRQTAAAAETKGFLISEPKLDSETRLDFKGNTRVQRFVRSACGGHGAQAAKIP